MVEWTVSSFKYHVYAFEPIELIHLSATNQLIVRSHLGDVNDKYTTEIQILEFESGGFSFTINNFVIWSARLKQWSDKAYKSVSVIYFKFTSEKLVHINRNLLINKLVLWLWLKFVR